MNSNLAQRAVSCESWRWMDGMRYRLHPNHPWFRWEGSDACDNDGNPVTEALPSDRSRVAEPDLTDPATVGCILHLARRAYANPNHLWGGRIEVHQDHHALFMVVRPEHDPNGALVHTFIASGPTEAEALLNALHQAKPIP